VTPATASFTERGHVYRDGDQVAPSVSQVLELAGMKPKLPRGPAARAGQRGKFVHRATQLLDRNELELKSIPETLAGFVLAYQRFKAEKGFVPIGIEERGVAELSGMKFGYCIDRVGILENELALIDLKTAATKYAWWEIQTAGYAEAIKHSGPRYVVHLKADGTYKLLPQCDADNFEKWLAALNVAHWKLAHGWKLPR